MTRRPHPWRHHPGDTYLTTGEWLAVAAAVVALMLLLLLIP